MRKLINFFRIVKGVCIMGIIEILCSVVADLGIMRGLQLPDVVKTSLADDVEKLTCVLQWVCGRVEN